MSSQSSTLRLADMAATDVDLRTVLAAWHDATVQWEQTHDSLKAEVRRLTAQLQREHRTLPFDKPRDDAGRIAARAGHRIHESLVQADLCLNLLRRRVLDDPGALTLVQNLASSVTAADTLADDLLQLTVQQEPVLRPVNLRALVEEVHASLLSRLSAQGVKTTIDVADQVAVAADRDMLRQAVLRLTLNALDAMPAGGELVVTSCVGSRAVELEIADSGHGLSDEARTRAFEPFFTTKPAGTGLGLAIVRRIVEAHSGDVTVANCPEGGAAFTLCFPRQALQAAA